MPRLPESDQSRDRDPRFADWNIADCARILRRRKSTILWLTCLGGLTGAFLAGTQSRVYESKAAVELRTLNQDFLDLSDVFPMAAPNAEGMAYIQTQAELLRQDSLIEEATRRVHANGGVDSTRPWNGLRGQRPDVTIMPVRNTRIIQIVCRAPDASLAADLANSMVNVFMEQSIRTRQRAARQTYDMLRLQLAELAQRMNPLGPRRPASSNPRLVTGPLTPEADATRDVYAAMLQNANQARLASVVRQSNVELIARAEPAARPLKPNLRLDFALGILGGLVLAVGIVMLHEQSRSILRSPSEAASWLVSPVLGVIPDAGVKKRYRTNLFASARARICAERTLLEDRSSPVAESFRSLAASILSSNGHHARVLVITSSGRSEGKTTVAANLGVALAEAGNRVLLVDGEMRHPRLHHIFRLPNTRGLSDLLHETAIDELSLNAAAKPTEVPGLYLLPGGTSAGQTSSLSTSGKVPHLFESLSEEFDHVLIDMPLCVESLALNNLIRYAGGFVLVVRANYTSRPEIEAAMQALQSGGVRLTGVILNRWDAFGRDTNQQRPTWTRWL
ncbi:MAG TPA: polysaccharide biosynthesis tyrosine autokinase [Bryobacteraceae bacterium]|nr:polysaccharide biosynthesis tyrosine autokinase [Bryobacteraceae bacterium]